MLSPDQPRLPGAVGWTTPDVPAGFDPEHGWSTSEARRHLPAVVRFLSVRGFPNLNEEDCFAAVRAMNHGTRLARVKTFLEGRRPAPNARGWYQGEQKMLYWLRLHPVAHAWWSSRWAWRSPKEFTGWRSGERSVDAPHVEPYELARLRLPDDIVMDFDVVMLQAWCQGLTTRFIERRLAEEPLRLQRPVPSHLLTGLRKLHASPWFQFLLAAPHMQPVGVAFPGSSFTENLVRTEWLITHPYEATDAELAVILGSFQFRVSYGQALQTRRDGQYMLPDGPWYSDGNSACLGKGFRRGGTQPWRGGPHGEEEEG